MGKVEIVSVVKVTLQNEDADARRAKMAQLKQQANQFGGRCLYTGEETNETVAFFAGDNPEMLSVILAN